MDEETTSTLYRYSYRYISHDHKTCDITLLGKTTSCFNHEHSSHLATLSYNCYGQGKQ